MSNSYKKSPYTGICGKSEKIDKQSFNRGFRTKTKSLINKGILDELPQTHNPKHGGNWNFTKDGKLRFNPKTRPELLLK